MVHGQLRLITLIAVLAGFLGAGVQPARGALIIRPLAQFEIFGFQSLPFMFEGRPVETGEIEFSLDPDRVSSFAFETFRTGRAQSVIDAHLRLDFPFLDEVRQPPPRLNLRGRRGVAEPIAPVLLGGTPVAEAATSFALPQSGEITAGFFAGTSFDLTYFLHGFTDLTPDEDGDGVLEMDPGGPYTSIAVFRSVVTFPERLGGETVDPEAGEQSISAGVGKVPEPSTLALLSLGLGAFGLLGYGSQRRKLGM